MNFIWKPCSKPYGMTMEAGQSTSQFSPDKRSYVAAKIIPGFGTLIYMACTDNPELGWDENGFANFNDISQTPYPQNMNMNMQKEDEVRTTPTDQAGPSNAPF